MLKELVFAVVEVERKTAQSRFFQLDCDCEFSVAPDYEYVSSPTALHQVSDLIFDIQKVR